jgi:hypothetical protein
LALYILEFQEGKITKIREGEKLEKTDRQKQVETDEDYCFGFGEENGDTGFALLLYPNSRTVSFEVYEKPSPLPGKKGGLLNILLSMDAKIEGEENLSKVREIFLKMGRF